MIAKHKQSEYLTPDERAIGRLTVRKARSNNGKLTAGTEVISTPNGRVKVSADDRNIGGKTLSRVSLDKLVRHPDNRHPTKDAIERMAASIQNEGLLEPIVVRRAVATHTKDQGFWEIISGETRVLAMQKLSRKGEIDAHIIECTDARALELLAIYNAERSDLNPIEKARMIKRLCEPLESGGGGMTRDQAAKVYGLETGSAASNLVRLLELPDVWQQRVASGEFPQTFARLLVPYCHAPRLMDAINTEYQKIIKSKHDKWEGRSDVERGIDRVVSKNIRPIEKKHFEHFGYEFFERKGSDQFRYSGRYERLFDLTPEIEEDLDIVELADDEDKKRKFATNCAVYDKLQIPLMIASHDKTIKKSAASKGSEKKQTKQLTPAEQKKNNELKRKQLVNRISVWRHSWIESLIFAELASNRNDSRIKLACSWYAIYLATQCCSSGYRAMPKEKLSGQYVDREWLDEAARQIAKESFANEGEESRTEPLDVAERLAAMLDVDLAISWAEMPLVRLGEFLQLHQNAQLDDLASERGIFVKEASGKDQKINLMTTNAKMKQLPKCVKPLTIAGRK